MNQWIDWNCRLLPTGLFPEQAAQANAQAIHQMHERYGFSRFCMMADFDHTKESVSEFLLRRDRSLSLLKHALPTPSGIHLSAGCAVLLSPRVSEVRDLARLKLCKTEYLALSMPLCAYADWMDTELNHLLYRQRLPLLFLSFERCMLLYPQDITEKLLRIPHAVFQFAFKSLCDKRVINTVARILEKGGTVLLGSAINSFEKLFGFDFDYYAQCAAQNLDVADFQHLLHQSHTFASR